MCACVCFFCVCGGVCECILTCCMRVGVGIWTVITIGHHS